MEKKDYYSLQSKYSHLEDYREQYREKLLDFINDAFEKHGNEFEYKCDTHASWKEKNNDEEDCFDAMEDLPVNITIWVDDDGGHEVYPTIIRQYVYDSGYKSIEVDGWDWYDGDWVENREVNSTLGELQDVANFINAVLEQEQNWLKVGSKVKWNDPGIDDYDEEDRETVLNRVFTIEKINGEVILISDNEGTEAEVFACELDPVD